MTDYDDAGLPVGRVSTASKQGYAAGWDAAEDVTVSRILLDDQVLADLSPRRWQTTNCALSRTPDRATLRRAAPAGSAATGRTDGDIFRGVLTTPAGGRVAKIDDGHAADYRDDVSLVPRTRVPPSHAPTDKSGQPPGRNPQGVPALLRRPTRPRRARLRALRGRGRAPRRRPSRLLAMSGPGNTKTETVVPMAGIGADIERARSAEAALLSATPTKERAKDATGGLLRRIGDRWPPRHQDVTFIRRGTGTAEHGSWRRCARSDERHWGRNVGTDGGKTLTWPGRLGLVGAATTAWDSAHQVVATMGDRVVLVRHRLDRDSEPAVCWHPGAAQRRRRDRDATGAGQGGRLPLRAVRR